MKNKPKFFIITTVSDSMPFFKGQLNVLKEIFDISLVSSQGIELTEMTQEYQVKGYPLKMQREISIFKDFISLINLLFLFSKHRPQIVHGNTPKASLLSMIAAWLCCIPVRIYYVHGLRYQGVKGAKRKLLIMMEQITCFFATNVIAVSKGAKEQMKKDNITNKKIELIWNGSINGIDLEYFDPEKIEKISIDNVDENDFVFGFAGRIVEDKGIIELLTAFNIISQKYKNVKLFLLGIVESQNESHILNLIRNNTSINYLGFQKDIRPYIKRMNVFVLPSYREGLCGVILEASALETPIIATNISGIVEVVQDRKTGYLIKPKDVGELQDMMEKCILYNDDLKKMSIASREFVKENYEQKRLWEITKEKYLQIIKDRNV